MNSNLLSCKLNLLAERLGLSNKVLFLSDNSKFDIIKFIKKTAPYSNVAVFSTRKTFLECGLALIELLKAEFLRPTSVIIEKQKRLNIDDVSKTFNLSEEVRFLIVTDNELIETGLYYSTVKNIPMLLTVNSFNFGGIFANKIVIDNGNVADEFKTTSQRIIFFDETRICSSSVLDGIATVGAKLIALVDYKINATIKGELENERLVEAISNAINIISELACSEKEDVYDDVLYATFSIELARAVDCGKLFECSSAINTALNLEGSTLCSAKAEFFSAKKIIDCYMFAFCGTKKGESVPNYNQIASQISKVSRRDQIAVSEEILNKLSILNCCAGVKVLRTAIKNIILQTHKQFRVIENIYHMFGGEENYCSKAIKSSVEISGYMGNYINGMTLYSEFGFSIK